MSSSLTHKFMMFLSIALPGTLAAQTAAYIRGANPPWAVTTNEQAMTAVFGAEGVGWDDLRMADGAGPFSAGYTFIFLEGGDLTANELEGFLSDHRTAIEAYVGTGGFLLLNSSPNQGDGIDFGFGGVTLGRVFTDEVTAAGPHPVFAGPFTPVVSHYFGGSFAGAALTDSLNPIILVVGGILLPAPPPGATVLGEKVFGAGCVVFGAMTTDNFHSPQPEAANLRRNIISYTANGCGSPIVSLKAPGIPTLSGLGLALLVATVAVAALFASRSRLAS